MEMYKEVVEGFIIVYSLEEFFLKWDVIGNYSSFFFFSSVNVIIG